VNQGNRRSVPSAMCYDAAQDRVWCYFGVSQRWQCWKPLAPSRLSSSAHGDVDAVLATPTDACPAIASFVLKQMGRIASIVTTCPLLVRVDWCDTRVV
jgi:hypothetical protein